MNKLYGIWNLVRLASHGKVLTRPLEILLLNLWICVAPLWYIFHSHRKSPERVKKYADTIVSMAFQSLIIYSQSSGLALCQNLKNWLLNQAEKFKRPKFCLITFHILSHLWQNVLIYFFENKILLSVQNNGFGSFQHLLVESQKEKYKRGG